VGFWAAEVLHTTHTKAHGTNTYLLKCPGDDKFYEPTSMVIK
jgi:hypothetical protein